MGKCIIIKNNYFQWGWGVSESVQNQVHTIDYKRGVRDSGFKFQTDLGFRIQISNMAGFNIHVQMSHYPHLSQFNLRTAS